MEQLNLTTSIITIYGTPLMTLDTAIEIMIIFYMVVTIVIALYIENRK